MDKETDETVKRIEILHAEGESIREIAKTLKKSPSTVSHILQSSSSSTVPEAKSEQLRNTYETPAETTKQRKGDTVVHSMESDEKVQTLLFRTFEEVAHRELLSLFEEKFIQKFRAGAILVHYDTLYRNDLEEIEWYIFIDFTFLTAYKLVMDEHIRQMFGKRK